MPKYKKREEENLLVEEKQPDFVVVEKIEEDGGKLKVSLEVKDGCTCINYDGDSFTCSKHEPVNECPNCQTIKTDLFVNEEYPPLKNYRCRICGRFYMRNSKTGEYIV